MKAKDVHSPFSDLDRILRERGILPRKPAIKPPCRKTDTDENDENVLFAAAMKGTVALTGRTSKVAGKHRVARNASNLKENGDKLLRDVLERDRFLTVQNLPEYMEGFAEGTSPLTLEKLRRGEFSVQRILDLHGYDIDTAVGLFRLFISKAIRDCLNCVKIIHGRGLNSKGEALLKESLKAWIVRAIHRKWVTAFCCAVMHDGGPGATYILLKKRPVKKPIRIMG